KRPVQPFDGPWLASLGKLTHQWFRHPLVRDQWFQALRVRISGNFLYPPGGFREWHTNAHDMPGWRLYYVQTAVPHASWFHYVDPLTQDMHVLEDRDQHFNLFDLHSRDGWLWHSVYSNTHRCSLGLHVSDAMARSLIQRAEAQTTDH